MSSVDIAIPCYQYGRYLRDCVASVLSQDIDDLRILIIDNASTDNSVAIARQLAEEDARVSLLARSQNSGAARFVQCGRRLGRGAVLHGALRR